MLIFFKYYQSSSSKTIGKLEDGIEEHSFPVDGFLTVISRKSEQVGKYLEEINMKIYSCRKSERVKITHFNSNFIL